MIDKTETERLLDPPELLILKSQLAATRLKLYEAQRAAYPLTPEERKALAGIKHKLDCAQVPSGFLENRVRILISQRDRERRAGWQPIETAPKDGRLVILLTAAYTDEPFYEGDTEHHHPARVALGYWNPEGDSWVDEYGHLGGTCYTLAVTGTWSSELGWFQPNEVTHWMALPALPEVKP
jgi:hypothetical protein